MNSTAEVIYVSNADEYIREECWLREERIAHEEYQKKQFENLNKKLKALTKEKASLSDENASLSNENASLSDEIARLRKLLDSHSIKAD